MTKQTAARKILSSPLYLASVTGFNKFVDPVYNEWEKQLLRFHKRLLLLKPRGTFKSTLYSVIYPAWLLLRNPNLRIIIIARVQDDAAILLEQIRTILQHPVVSWVFGEQFERNNQGSFVKQKFDQLELKNRTDKTTRGVNIRIYGMNSSVTGSHCDVMIIDDACDDHDSFSQSVREKRIKIFQQNIKVVDESDISQILIVGTRKHPRELYGYIIDEINPKMIDLNPEASYHVEVETPYNENNKLRFPTYLNNATIDQNKVEMGTYTFNHEMMNNPMSDEELIFYESDVEQYYYDYNQLMARLQSPQRSHYQLYAYLDLAISESSSADFNAVTIGAFEMSSPDTGKQTNKLYILDGKRIKGNPTKIYQVILSLHDKYKGYNGRSFDLLGIEDNGFQKEWIKNFERYSSEIGYQIPIRGIQNRVNKRSRIVNVQPLVQRGDVLFASNWRNIMREYMDEIFSYPATNHDDCADSLAGICEITRKDVTRFISAI